MTTEHAPYACPICLGITEVMRWFPTALRMTLIAIGIASGVAVAGDLIGIFVGALAGSIAAELVGAAIVYSLRRWLRRRMAKLDDPAWREGRDRYLAEMRRRQRRCDSIVNYRCEVKNVSQYPMRR